MSPFTLLPLSVHIQYVRIITTIAHTVVTEVSNSLSSTEQLMLHYVMSLISSASWCRRSRTEVNTCTVTVSAMPTHRKTTSGRHSIGTGSRHLLMKTVGGGGGAQRVGCFGCKCASKSCVTFESTYFACALHSFNISGRGRGEMRLCAGTDLWYLRSPALTFLHTLWNVTVCLRSGTCGICRLSSSATLSWVVHDLYVRVIWSSWDCSLTHILPVLHVCLVCLKLLYCTVEAFTTSTLSLSPEICLGCLAHV